MTRMMEVPTPCQPAEIEEMWQKYFAEFREQMPDMNITETAVQAMRDAFYHGALAILVRNAPTPKTEVIH